MTDKKTVKQIEHHITKVIDLLVDGDSLEDVLKELDVLLKTCGSDKTTNDLTFY